MPRPHQQLLAVFLVAAVACDSAPDGAARDEATSPAGLAPLAAPVELASPTAPGSGEPSLTPLRDGRALLSWIEPAEGGHALRFAALRDSSWSEPVTIATGDDWFVNWADFPVMVELEPSGLAAHYLEREGAGTYAYGVRVVLSRDGGASWSEPVTPHTDGTESEHGFVSLYDAGEGSVGAVWLDGRQYAQGDEEMTVRHAVIGRDGALREESEIDARACDCCQTALATPAGGPVLFYRDRSEDEVRDISFARLEDGRWSEPATLHADGWQIAACPVNGPQADAVDERVAVAWFTAANDSPRVHVAFSDDSGRSFGMPLRIDDGDPSGRVDLVTLGDGSAVVVWLERVDGVAEVRTRRVRRDGAQTPAVTLSRTEDARTSGFPRMTRYAEGIVYAWTSPGSDGRPAEVLTALISLR